MLCSASAFSSLVRASNTLRPLFLSLSPSRRSGYSKGEVEYVLATDQRTKTDRDQMKRDITHACNNFVYSNLKILEHEPVASSSPEQATVKFQYKVRSDVSL